ncbi:MAG TPA: hypothetical protein VMT52_13390 [Planctomycetota bacterium]|nr:hypothetical protein [Planctomycetota bacterium]
MSSCGQAGSRNSEAFRNALGLDHKKVTFRFGGRDMRLTGVHGLVPYGIVSGGPIRSADDVAES